MEFRRTQIGWSMPPLRDDTPPRIIDELQKRSFFGKSRNSNGEDDMPERRHTGTEATKPRILNKHHLRNNKSRMTDNSKEESKVAEQSYRMSNAITEAFPKISPLDFRVSQVLHSTSHTTDLETPRQFNKVDQTLTILQSDHHRLQEQHRKLIDQHSKNQEMIIKMRENECQLSKNLDSILLNVKLLQQNLKQSQQNNRILKIDLVSRDNKLTLLEQYEHTIRNLQQKLKITEQQLRCRILQRQHETITFARQANEKDEMQEELKQLTETIKEKEVQIQQLKQRLLSEETSRTQLNTALLESNTQLKESNETLQQFNQALKESQHQIEFLHEKIQQLEKQIKEHHEISKVTWLQSKVDSLQQQLFELKQQKKQKIVRSGQFNHFLKDQIEDNQKLKNSLTSMDDQLRSAQQQLCSQRFVLQSYKNEVEMEKLRSLTDKKTLQVQFDIRQQNLKNQIGSLKKLLFVTQQRLRIAINDNIHKDDFIKMHIIGKTKSQYDRKDIEQFFKQYEISMPKESLGKALKQQMRIIEKQKEEIEKLKA